MEKYAPKCVSRCKINNRTKNKYKFKYYRLNKAMAF